ncbi:MAG: hypothetical protein KUA35_05240 [Pseudodesulfovibrio sp.]|uniref:Uncharacterized protein n=1 Tax=Pseudodesulfovibrio aespoeensis (strain ATCC 700646 / DSM 10631 / Aspo-2) TaxID=643562 RepID=E6VRG7_PSEA9|nr:MULTISPECIES: hypothetical protein [Pseudodesulfovibrio]MBU4475892.1 hypothetical protein [Pseudomonadota bacterium]ADU63004.1 hypothetical protein Daes_1995 [Pseudodesulfovibrio aespoeensis Aspo-2]MBU4516730.1 hypothetical protein [Pseudomonadota bacterium]MBU4522687.1 hypothetical protein [Pseudomonadota bacterium]MBU4558835.1 hypothetical protein [Pseudomonadota bacterium]
MDRISKFFKSKSLAVLLFLVGMLLFNWPILSMPSGAGETSIFSYLIIAWFVIVVLLIAMGEFTRRTGKTDGER